MAAHVSKAFTDAILHVDGQGFLDCEFRRCDLIYSGGELPNFDGCTFDACRWQLDAHAKRTLGYLHFLIGLKDDNVRNGILAMLGMALDN